MDDPAAPVDPAAQRRDFRAVATALGGDPDLAQARAEQLARERSDQSSAEVYLAVLRELCLPG